MKLTHGQIDDIALYLESKGLYQLDLKHEVLDHMVTGVENTMSKDGLGFIDAFETQRNKWKKELALRSSWWLGTTIKQPKPGVVTKRLVNMVKKMYTKSILGTFPLMALFYILTESGVVSETMLKHILGYGYFLCLFILFFMFLKMNKTHTISGYLFKKMLITYSVWLLIFNPVIMESRLLGKDLILFFFIHAFLIAFAPNILLLYKSHGKTIKRYLV